ncbi:MAG TPA: ferrochelatase [Candidatus Saccharimonadales bacterium]|nr:ferrochelatase [Candidatus Saccharimonadales bacterium]
MTTGVVLMTYGAPRDDADLPGYLARVRGGREPEAALVTEMRARYARIGGSPLVAITQAQAAALEAALGPEHRAAAGMRFSDPSVTAAVRDVVARGADTLVGLCLSPQWSPLLMGGYERALAAAAAEAGVPSRMAGAWHDEPLFAAALAERINEALRDIADPEVPLLLTAHSLPKRVFDTEQAYIAQLRETADLVARAAGLAPERWQWAYQSAGHTAEEWLRPDLKELFPALAAARHRDVLVVPIQFLADHLEVLYDLDVAARDEASAAGLRYHRTLMPNTQPAFIAALAAVVSRTETLSAVA